jgi:hypothetical protein
MEKVAALLTAILALAERYLPTLAVYFIGKGVAENEKQKETLQQAQENIRQAEVVNGLHASLDDDGVRKLALDRAERLRLRLKARAANAEGGADD